MKTSDDQEYLSLLHDQDYYNWLERLYGTSLDQSERGKNAALQNYGSIETREGRLLAFPNILYVPPPLLLSSSPCKKKKDKKNGSI